MIGAPGEITSGYPCPTPFGPSCGRSNLLQANLSNLEFSSDPSDTPFIKKPAKKCGFFYDWRARRDYFGLSLPYALRAVLRTFKFAPGKFVELGVLI